MLQQSMLMILRILKNFLKYNLLIFNKLQKVKENISFTFCNYLIIKGVFMMLERDLFRKSSQGIDPYVPESCL